MRRKEYKERKSMFGESWNFICIYFTWIVRSFPGEIKKKKKIQQQIQLSVRFEPVFRRYYKDRWNDKNIKSICRKSWKILKRKGGGNFSVDRCPNIGWISQETRRNFLLLSFYVLSLSTSLSPYHSLSLSLSLYIDLYFLPWKIYSSFSSFFSYYRKWIK